MDVEGLVDIVSNDKVFKTKGQDRLGKRKSPFSVVCGRGRNYGEVLTVREESFEDSLEVFDLGAVHPYEDRSLPADLDKGVSGIVSIESIEAPWNVVLHSLLNWEHFCLNRRGNNLTHSFRSHFIFLSEGIPLRENKTDPLRGSAFSARGSYIFICSKQNSADPGR